MSMAAATPTVTAKTIAIGATMTTMKRMTKTMIVMMKKTMMKRMIPTTMTKTRRTTMKIMSQIMKLLEN